MSTHPASHDPSRVRPGEADTPGAAQRPGEAACPACGGSGLLDGAPCPECDGTGRVAGQPSET